MQGRSFNHMPITVAFFTLALTIGLCGPVSARQHVTDEELSYRVREAVRRDARVDSSRLRVVSHEGIVTISGVVDTLTARHYADLEAKKIDGVLGVLNEISVEPVWRSDADLRQTVRRKILSSSVIRSQRVRVFVVHGAVSLEGTVDSEVERNEVELLASQVRGVKAVKNNLEVLSTQARTATEIEADARTALNLDVYLSSLPISVAAERGVIRLTGTVGSAFERERAEWKMHWLPGVKEVKNDLSVRWWENTGERKREPVLSDDQIRKSVLEILRLDPRVEPDDISVHVSSGLVRLGGSVPIFHQVAISEQDAREIVGVVGVTNFIVSHPQTRADWAVTEDVRHNLRTDPITEDLDISVEVRKGVATLAGVVGNWSELEHAKDVVGRVQGVRLVIDQLSMEPTHNIEDAHIATEVRFGVRWNWSTSAVAKRIHVAVEDGIVQLTGDVDRWSQRAEAERVALRVEGVRKVVNHVQIKNP